MISDFFSGLISRGQVARLQFRGVDGIPGNDDFLGNKELHIFIRDWHFHHRHIVISHWYVVESVPMYILLLNKSCILEVG